MEMAEALSAGRGKIKKEKPMLRGIMLKKADNGGVVAEHHMSGGGSWENKEPMHAFGADEGHKLAAHISEHLGIAMPGHAEEPEEE